MTSPTSADDPFRVYFDPAEVGADGYPYAWHKGPAIKHLVRARDGHRCLRCKHPFVVGETPGEWSPCDEHCTHGGPTRLHEVGYPQAQWRVLTVHHLNGIKYDCRWHNLVSLCQRCHLTIQGKVYMERPWHKQHSEWFRPFVAAYYASTKLGLELSYEEVMERLQELLDLESRQEAFDL